MATALAGCGDDPRSARERAQSPQEPTLQLVPAIDGPGRQMSATIGFASHMSVKSIRVTSPLPVQPGQPIALAFRVEGQPTNCRVGARPPRSSARQIVPRGDDPPHTPDPRDTWVDLPASAGEVDLKLELPSPWHPNQAILELVCAGNPATSGPRTDDGRALLAAVPVANQPTSVSVPRLSEPLVLDGKLSENIWQQAGHPLVTSLEGEPDPEVAQTTRVWLAWDPDNLYVAGDLPDVDLFTSYKHQDDPLYKQDVFEVFLAADNSGNNYLELQVSARGVTFDAKFPRYRKGDEAWDSSWQTAVDVRG
ncbi:MAG: carbohydrate-binding family 9-like protein, partial [Nannocystaceae bacterium]